MIFGKLASRARRLPRMAFWLLASLILPCSWAFTADDIIREFKQSQKIVEDRWRFSDALVCKAARVHGRVRKAANFSAVANFITPDRDALHALETAGVPVFYAVQVWVSHKYRFIYIRQPKSSSSAMLNALMRKFCERDECSPQELVNARDAAPLTDETWARYFVFTVVRNPISRLLSAYNMFKNFLRVRLKDGAPGGPCGGNITFLHFSRDVSALQSICKTQNCCAWAAREFSSRETWLEKFPAGHTSQQAHTVFTPAGHAAVDYIGRMEHLMRDWREIQATIAERLGEEDERVRIANYNPRGNHTEVQADAALEHPCLAPDVVAMGILNATTAHNLARQFAMDMTFFGFV